MALVYATSSFCVCVCVCVCVYALQMYEVSLEYL